MAASDARAACPPESACVGSVEQASRQTEVGAHRAGARVEVRAAGREVGVERGAVRVGGVTVGRRVSQGGRRPFELGFGGGHPGAAGEEREQRLVAPLELLRQVADPQRRRGRGDRAAIGTVAAGEQAQQRRLADAVRTDHTETRPRPDGHVDGVEDGEGAVRARQVTGDE